MTVNQLSRVRENHSGLTLIWPAIPLSLLGLALVLSQSMASTWTWEPPLLLLVLNVLFLTIIPGLIAVFGVKAYLQSGRLGLLLLGAGALSLGMTGMLTGWYMQTAGGINTTVTIYNCGFLVAGLLHLIGVIAMTERGAFSIQSPRLRRPLAFAAYTGAALTIASLAMAAWQARLPLFFLQGVGPTPLRQVVIGSAMVAFLISALLILNIYRQSHSHFLYWYGWGLALIALGLVAIMAITLVGGAVNWIGRVAQYLGGIYLLVAVISARRARLTASEVAAELSRQPHELHAAIFENSLDGILVMFLDGRIIDANAQACAMLGYADAEISQGRVESILDREHPKTAELLATIRGAGKWNGDTHLIKKDGSRFPAEISASCFINRQGAELMTFMIRDITRREQAEAHLRESEERYRGLFNSMSEGFALAEMIYDEQGRPCDYRFLEVNPAFDRITGSPPMPTPRPIFPQSDPQWIETFATVVKTGKPVRFEHYVDDLRCWFDVTAFCPKPGQFAIVFNDITARQRHRELLEESQAALEEKVRERTEQLENTVRALEKEILVRRKAQLMLERLSRKTLETMENDRQSVAKELHDSVSASLAAIKFGLEAMPPKNNACAEISEAVRQAIAYLSDTIKESKRIAARLRPLMLEDLGLLSTIDWHVREFAVAYPRIAVIKNITVREEEIPETLKIVIYRIMQEALNNSARHSNAQQVIIRLFKNDETLVLEVEDNGSGFNPELIDRHDDPLSGHGLRSMRERAEICGGSFELNTGSEKGVRVTARLPFSMTSMFPTVKGETDVAGEKHHRRIGDRM